MEVVSIYLVIFLFPWETGKCIVNFGDGSSHPRNFFGGLYGGDGGSSKEGSGRSLPGSPFFFSLATLTPPRGEESSRKRGPRTFFLALLLHHCAAGLNLAVEA